MLEKPQSEEQRKEIFLALVQAQDGGASVADSRKLIGKLFVVSEQTVRRVEREGLDHGWPPLEALPHPDDPLFVRPMTP
jgi:hypothetical protein